LTTAAGRIAGKQVTKLALIFEDNLSFVIGDDLIVRKLKFLDGALGSGVRRARPRSA